MTKSNDSYQKAMKLINKYSESIKNENQILLRGYGLDYAGPDKLYDGKIHVIDLSYSIDRNMKYQDAKKMFYILADGLLKELNKNESVKECFYHFPIGYEDLHFSLSFDYENKGYLKMNDVKQISIQKNEIVYLIVNADGATNELAATETYPGMGTLTFTGMGSMRVIARKLPENEDLNEVE